MTRRPGLATCALVLLAACGGRTDPGADGGEPVDARGFDTGTPAVDGGPPDTGPACDERPDAGPETTYEEAGLCFVHTLPCCSDDQCTLDCLPTGRCRGYEICMCASESDCMPGRMCLTNETLCGGCVPPPQDCMSDDECIGVNPPYRCVGGRCQSTTCFRPMFDAVE